METRDTLNGFRVNWNRQSGNSTRQVNFAIDLLFEGFRVEVKDHHERGTNRKANRYLMDMIWKRLESEHKDLVDSGKVKGNASALTIEFNLLPFISIPK